MNQSSQRYPCHALSPQHVENLIVLHQIELKALLDSEYSEFASWMIAKAPGGVGTNFSRFDAGCGGSLDLDELTDAVFDWMGPAGFKSLLPGDEPPDLRALEITGCSPRL